MLTMANRGKRYARLLPAGFTLIELLVVLAIVAILVGVAVPSYNAYVLKSRRTDAKQMLYMVAQRQQQYYTRNNSYTADTGALGLGDSPTSANDHYTLQITASATSYTLSAVPAGSQASDSACGTFRLTNQGVKTVTGSQTSPPCW
jgi:type IV pilus assembly protein PilE